MILVVMPVFIVVLVVLVTVIVVLAVVVLVCPGRDLSVFVFVGLALITLVVAVVVIFRFTLVSGLPLWLHAVHVGVLLQHPHHWNMVSGIQLAWLSVLPFHRNSWHAVEGSPASTNMVHTIAAQSVQGTRS